MTLPIKNLKVKDFAEGFYFWRYFWLFYVVLAIALALLPGVKKPQQQQECPPFDGCTGKVETNHPNCKCWDNK